MTDSYIAKVSNVSKEYVSGDTTITALHPTSLRISKGELVLLLGPSGSGKTTLLSLLGCVIYPTEGGVFVSGRSVTELKDRELSNLRLQEIGFVFQSYNLIAPLTALENVMMPLQLLKISKKETKERAIAALTSLGMADRMNNIPKKLSGGQQQRVAIARALVTDPSLILCDEPTASLDPKSVTYTMERLKALTKENRAVVIVTHDLRLIPYADCIYEVDNGHVTETTKENATH
ncbi:ABC transporter ATP-binding protein [Maribacter sp. 2-571]|uniref:ABC transporter ATP-binding protein n=1 Tax=Maribacter sp. 2-571 TaxID=3417569 RepID=UPI003D34A044